MLTPIEIQGKVFKSGLGYDKKDVDAFMKDVSMYYEKLYKESVELNDKVSVLSEGLQYYKTIEKTLQKALVLAERTAEDTRLSAEKKADAILKQAHVDAKLIVAEAKNELEKVHVKTIQLIQQYDKYKAQFAHLAAMQMDLLNSDAFQIEIANLDTFLNATMENKEAERIHQSEEKVQVESHTEAAATYEESTNFVEKLPDSDDSLLENLIRMEELENETQSELLESEEWSQETQEDPFEFIQDEN